MFSKSGTRNFIRATFLTVSIAIGVAGTTTLADEIDANPYVALYARRVEIAKLDVERQRAVAAYEQASFDRAKALYTVRAMSLEEVEERQAKLRVANASVADFALRVTEAEALLDIAKTRALAGLDMPILSNCRGAD